MCIIIIQQQPLLTTAFWLQPKLSPLTVSNVSRAGVTRMRVNDFSMRSIHLDLLGSSIVPGTIPAMGKEKIQVPGIKIFCDCKDRMHTHLSREVCIFRAKRVGHTRALGVLKTQAKACEGEELYEACRACRGIIALQSLL